jgi:hypothetical protein
MISLGIIGGCIERFIIPHLSPEKKFKIWWKRHIIDEMSDHL